MFLCVSLEWCREAAMLSGVMFERDIKAGQLQLVPVWKEHEKFSATFWKWN